MPELRAATPGGKLERPAGTVTNRWLGVAEGCEWATRRASLPTEIATGVVNLLGDGEINNLTNKQAHVAISLLNEVAVAALFAGADALAMYRQATLWSQQHQGLRVPEMAAYLEHFWQKHKEMRAVIAEAASSVEPKLLQMAVEAVSAWLASPATFRRINPSTAAERKAEAKGSKRASNSVAAAAAAAEASDTKSDAPVFSNQSLDGGRWRSEMKLDKSKAVTVTKELVCSRTPTLSRLVEAEADAEKRARLRAIGAVLCWRTFSTVPKRSLSPRLTSGSHRRGCQRASLIRIAAKARPKSWSSSELTRRCPRLLNC